MGPQRIEVPDVALHEPVQMALTEDKKMVEALPADGTDEALAIGIGLGGANGRGQHFDLGTSGRIGKRAAVFIVVVADEVARPLAEGGSVAQLLSGPGIGRMARDADLHHAA